MLSTVETVIVDEIHAVASVKRGAHLALTLERLDEQARAGTRSGAHPEGHRRAGGEIQRVGLSATQNPLEEVGRFLVGPRRAVRIVDAGMSKPLDLRIHVPVESMSRAVRPARRSAGAGRGGRAHAQFDLAGDLPGAVAAHTGASLDDRVRQQQALRRACGIAAQRAGSGGEGLDGAAPEGGLRGVPVEGAERVGCARSRERTMDRSRGRSGPWWRSS